MEGTKNQEKSGMDFDKWLYRTYPDENARAAYKERHYIPPDVDLSFENFREFIEQREQLQQLLFSKLKELLT